MRTFKKLGVLVAVLALSAIGAATASAEFTYSATGNLSGKATATQVFTTNAGQVKCTVTETAGNIVSTATTEQHVTATHKNCTAFGFANVHVSPTTLLLTKYGTFHIKNTFTINTTLGCHQTVHPQTVGTVGFSNAGASNITVTPNLTGIAYTSTGGLCGSSGNNGTYTGTSEFSRVGGVTIRFDP